MRKKFFAVIDLLTESWRLNQFTKKLAQVGDAKLQRKISNQVARFDKHFLAADENLIVAAMLEPTIKFAGAAELIKCGAAVLGRKVE